MSFSIPADINSWDRLRTAEFYHRDLGWAIHALCPPNRGQDHERGKKPIAKGWRSHTSAEVTPDYLREHFANGSNFNVGVVVRGPFVHVDLDSKPDAGESVRTWLSSQPQLATIPRERTGGGAHLVFVCRDLPEGVAKAKKAITAQVNANVTAEFYADGMNLVVSPSVHKSGARYVWDVTGEIPEVSWTQIRQWFGFEEPAGAKRGRPPKEKPWWARFKGALHSLDAVALFKEADLLGDCIDPDAGKWSVHCPWESEHSGTKGGNGCDTDTVIFQGETADSPPGFKCLHAHCAERSLKDVLETLDDQKPGIVDRHCREMRVWIEGQASPDGRQRVLLPEMDRPDSEFAAEMGQQIGPRKVWFNKAETVVAVAMRRFSENITALTFHPIQPVEACTAAEQFVQTGVLREDKASGDMIFLRHTMTRECAAKLMIGGACGTKTHLLGVALAARVDFERHAIEFPFLVLAQGLADARLGVLGLAVLEAPEKGKVFIIGCRHEPEQFTLVDPGVRMIREHQRIERTHRLVLPVSADFTIVCKVWEARVSQTAGVHDPADDPAPFGEGIERRRSVRATAVDPPFHECADRAEQFRAMGQHPAMQVWLRVALAVGIIDDEDQPDFPGARFHVFAEREPHVRRHAELDLIRQRQVGLGLGAAEIAGREGLRRDGPDKGGVLNVTLAVGEVYHAPPGHECRRDSFAGLLALALERRVLAGAALIENLRHAREVVLAGTGTVAAVMPKREAGIPAHQSAAERRDDPRDGVNEALFVLPAELRVNLLQQLNGAFKGHRANARSFGIEVAAEAWVVASLGKDDAVTWSPDRQGDVEDADDLRQLSPELRRGQGRFQQITFAVFGRSGTCGTSYSSDLVSEEKCSEKKEKKRELKRESKRGGSGSSAPSSPSVVSEAGAFAEIASAITFAGSVALDVETFGSRKSDALKPWRGDMRLLSLKVAEREPWLIDLQATGYDLGPLSTALGSVLVIGHNLKFDALWLAVKCGLRLSRVFCTLVAARLLSAGTRPGNDLDKCLERYLGIKPADDHSRSDWGGMFLTDGQLAYAARDVAHLHALYDVLTLKLEQSGLGEVAGLEMDLQPVIVAMETAGIAVDRTKLESIRDQARAESEMQTAALRDALGDRQINLASPAQLQAALAKAGLSLANTNEETLKASGEERFVPIILAHRSAEKTAQQAQSLLECIAADGRIHGRFDPTGTATGRFSSKEPNLQNIGRGPLRECFIAPEGCKLVVADYSQIELRAAAAIAGETKMIEAYQRGEDLHRGTAAAVLGKPSEDISKEDRQLAKAVNFGLLYGQSAPGLVKYAASSYGVTLPEDDAREIRTKFFRTYGSLRQWHGESHRRAEQGVSEIRTVLGRRRLIPPEASAWERFTALVNTPVQGGCADGMKRALVQLASAIPASARIVSTVHDEIIVEAPEHEAEDIRRTVEAVMVEAMAALFPQVPVEVEANVCASWGEK